MPVQSLKIERRNLKILHELTAEDPRAEQPQCTLNSSIRLRNHQKAILYRLMQLEKKEIIICPDGYLDCERNGETNEQDLSNIELVKLLTSIGLLCDPVGAGKSYEILSLIATDENPSFQERQVVSLCRNKVIFEHEMPPNRSIPTNLIIIPSSLSRQWENYMNAFLPSSMKRIVLSNRRQFDHLFDHGISHYQVIVMTITFYKSHFLPFTLGTDMQDIIFRRIIIDEVDSFETMKIFNADFYWYVTASLNNIFHPCGDNANNINGFQSKRGPIFNDLVQIYNNGVLNASPLIVRNPSDFIKESYELPEPEVRIILCREP